jgi:hypothetical protein
MHYQNNNQNPNEPAKDIRLCRNRSISKYEERHREKWNSENGSEVLQTLKVFWKHNIIPPIFEWFKFVEPYTTPSIGAGHQRKRGRTYRKTVRPVFV